MFNKKIFIFFFYSFISLSYSQVILHDVAIFVDTSEDVDSKNLFVTVQAVIAFCQQASPIILTSKVFNNILQGKLLKNPKMAIDFSDWNIYKAKTNDWFLFIPIDYEKLNSQIKIEESKNDFPEEILTGFKINLASNKLIKIQVQDLDNLKSAEDINQLVPPIKEINIENLKNIFTKGKDDNFGKWNIFLTGHGYFPYKVTDINQYLDEQIINEIQNTGFAIAGLSLNKFTNFIQFLTNEINTNFLYYLTCFAGDVNFILPYITTIINKKGNVKGGIKKANFTIASGALTSQVVTNYYTYPLDILYASVKGKTQIVCPYNIKQKTKISLYNDFFKYLKQYSNLNTVKTTVFKDKELKDILYAITPAINGNESLFLISNIPSVKFPETDIFRAISVTDKIAIISNVLVKKHELEKKPIKFKNKDVVLIYPKEIDVDIEIESSVKKSTGIVSMIPGISLVKLNGLKTNIKFLDFIKISLASVAPIFKKFFYIKKLTVTNDVKQLFNFDKKYQLNQSIILENVIATVFLSMLDLQARKFKASTMEMRFTTSDGDIFIASQYENNFNLTPLAAKYKKVSENEFVNTIYNYYSQKGDYNELTKLLSKDELEILIKLEPNLSKIIADKEKAEKEIQQNIERNQKLLDEFISDPNKLKLIAKYPKKLKLLNEILSDVNKLNEFLKDKNKLSELLTFKPEDEQPDKTTKTKEKTKEKRQETPQNPQEAQKQTSKQLQEKQFKNVFDTLTNQANILQQFRIAQANKNTKRINQLRPQVQKIRQSLAKTNFNIINDQGKTPIMLNPNIAFAVAQIGKPRARNIVNAKDQKGKRVIQYVIQSKQNGNINIYRILKNSGVKVTQNDIKFINNKFKNRPKIRKQILNLLKKK